MEQMEVILRENLSAGDEPQVAEGKRLIQQLLSAENKNERLSHHVVLTLRGYALDWTLLKGLLEKSLRLALMESRETLVALDSEEDKKAAVAMARALGIAFKSPEACYNFLSVLAGRLQASGVERKPNASHVWDDVKPFGKICLRKAREILTDLNALLGQSPVTEKNECLVYPDIDNDKLRLAVEELFVSVDAAALSPEAKRVLRYVLAHTERFTLRTSLPTFVLQACMRQYATTAFNLFVAEQGQGGEMPCL